MDEIITKFKADWIASSTKKRVFYILDNVTFVAGSIGLLVYFLNTGEVLPLFFGWLVMFGYPFDWRKY